jgi:hypothetical protein
MNKVFIHRLISSLLLVAVMIVSVPIHQIFHQHVYKADLTQSVHLKKTEKPCCKPFEGLSGNVVSVAKVYFHKQPMNAVYRISYFSYFIKPLFDLSNKAPPVSLA